MIVYLDQNKWIELALIFHGKDKSRTAKEILDSLRVAQEMRDLELPLSAIHYMETARISNAGRKERLGAVMWEFSKGTTIASFKRIIIHELEVALSAFFPQIKVGHFNLLGKGISHAYGEKFSYSLPEQLESEFERSTLTGKSNFIDGSPPEFRSITHREKFRAHLAQLKEIKEELPKEKWDDMLHAIVLADIREPLAEVMPKYGLGKEDFKELGMKDFKRLIDNMPSRKLELHLHRQVLKNPNYAPKLNDLEDWAGIGVASQYCDVVVCEKHFADLIKRDHFKTAARIETNLKNIFSVVGAR